MSPPRLAAVCGAVVLAGWVVGGLVWFVFSGIDTAAPTEGSLATSAVGAGPLNSPKANAGQDGVFAPDAAIIDATSPDPRPMPRPETPSVQVASASMPDPMQGHVQEAVSSVEAPDECLAAEI